MSQTRAPTERTRPVFTVTAGPEAGRVIPIPASGNTTIGRDEGCAVRIEDAGLSRVHARLIRMGAQYVLADAQSTNGTYVNDAPADGSKPLHDGDRVQLGSTTVLRFAMVDEAEEQALMGAYEAGRRGGLAGSFEDRRGAGKDRRSTGEALDEDLRQAREFQQRALVPPPEIPGLGIEVIYRPVEVVGGDLYQFTQLEDGRLRIFMADASGHGVKASMMSMIILSEYEDVKARPAGPSAVLAALNQRIAETKGHMAVDFTAACLDFDFAEGVLKYAMAGHPAPLLARDGSVLQLEGGGPIMGAVTKARVPLWRQALRPGDGIFLFTDGAFEERNSRGEMFGEERLRTIIGGAVTAGTGAGASLTAEIDAFVGAGRPPNDDLTFIGIRWTPL